MGPQVSQGRSTGLNADLSGAGAQARPTIHLILQAQLMNWSFSEVLEKMISLLAVWVFFNLLIKFFCVSMWNCDSACDLRG